MIGGNISESIAIDSTNRITIHDDIGNAIAGIGGNGERFTGSVIQGRGPGRGDGAAPAGYRCRYGIADGDGSR
jgi:hypothetical protein